MAKTYNRIGKGAAFKNEDKQEGDNKPDYSGPAFEIELGGNTHNVSIAIYNSKAKESGKNYYSIYLTEVKDDGENSSKAPSESGRKDW